MPVLGALNSGTVILPDSICWVGMLPLRSPCQRSTSLAHALPQRTWRTGLEPAWSNRWGMGAADILRCPVLEPRNLHARAGNESPRAKRGRVG